MTKEADFGVATWIKVVWFGGFTGVTSLTINS